MPNWMKYDGGVLRDGSAIAISSECCCAPCCNINDLSAYSDDPPAIPATFQLEIIASTGDCASTWPVGSTAVMTEDDPGIWTNEGDLLVDSPFAHGVYTLACSFVDSILELNAIDCPSTSEEAKEGELLSLTCEPFEAVYSYDIFGSDLVCNCDPGGGTITIRVTRLT
jgi:hypothetical protein